jgi:nicotinate-nucleotide adenylyltransferase
VLLMPTGVAPHKEIAEDPGAEVRAEMARAAAGSEEGVEVSDLELRRPGPSYSYETVEQLRELMPGAEPVWLMGADAALALGSWERPERIVELAGLGIVGRDGVARSQIEEALAGAGAELGPAEALGPGTATAVDMPEVAVSSSMVRERVRDGRSIGDLVPDGVAELIVERGLYGGGSHGG